MLGWFELPEDDQPPRSIWLDEEALDAHFQGVRDRYRSGGDRTAEQIPLEQNELTRGLRS